MKKNIETKITSDTLEFFCVQNANNIVGCGWYDTKHCMKNCKFYNNKVKEIIAKSDYLTK